MRKLRTAIQKAQQRLRQNNQDTAIYEKIRNNFKTKRKRGCHARSQSKISEQQKSNRQLPELVKSKTQQPRGRKRKPIIQQTSKIQQEDEQDIQIDDEEQGEKPSKNQNQLNNKQQDEQQILSLKRNERSTRLRSRERKQEMKPQSEEEQEEQKSRSKSPLPTTKRGRKGRPRKNQFQQKLNESSQKQQFQLKSDLIIKPKSKRKGRNPGARSRKPFSTKSIPFQSMPTDGVISEQVKKDVQKVKSVVNNRNLLIKLLSHMKINSQNVKQILDQNVTVTLHQGNITKPVNILLNFLKATLLHKYFPQDTKYRKKYEKLLKQKNKLKFEQEVESGDQKLNNLYSTSKQNNMNCSNIIKNHSYTKCESTQVQQQIRKKTVKKLQKILRKLDIFENTDQYRRCAISVEESFNRICQEEQIKYNKVAYERMREFKDKVNEYIQNQISQNSVKEYLKNKLLNKEIVASLKWKNNQGNDDKDGQEELEEQNNMEQAQQQQQEEDQDEDDQQDDEEQQGQGQEDQDQEGQEGEQEQSEDQAEQEDQEDEEQNQQSEKNKSVELSENQDSK